MLIGPRVDLYLCSSRCRLSNNSVVFLSNLYKYALRSLRKNSRRAYAFSTGPSCKQLALNSARKCHKRALSVNFFRVFFYFIFLWIICIYVIFFLFSYLFISFFLSLKLCKVHLFFGLFLIYHFLEGTVWSAWAWTILYNLTRNHASFYWPRYNLISFKYLSNWSSFFFIANITDDLVDFKQIYIPNIVIQCKPTFW